MPPMPAADPRTWILTGSPENYAATREHGFAVIGLKERNRKVRRESLKVSTKPATPKPACRKTPSSNLALCAAIIAAGFSIKLRASSRPALKASMTITSPLGEASCNRLRVFCRVLKSQ